MPRIDEFDELPKKPEIIKHFTTMKENLTKNLNLTRIKDIVPYDQNIVQLKQPVNNVDFINASWVHIVQTSEGVHNLLILHPFLPSSMISLIIAQSSLDNTIDHHLRMTYESKVRLVSIYHKTPRQMEERSLMAQSSRRR